MSADHNRYFEHQKYLRLSGREEQFCKRKFGYRFGIPRTKCSVVFPTSHPRMPSQRLQFPFKEAAVAAAIMLLVLLAEQMESPQQAEPRCRVYAGADDKAKADWIDSTGIKG